MPWHASRLADEASFDDFAASVDHLSRSGPHAVSAGGARRWANSAVCR